MYSRLGHSIRGIRTALSFLNSSFSSSLKLSARKLYSPSSSSSSSATCDGWESSEGKGRRGGGGEEGGERRGREYVRKERGKEYDHVKQ